MTEMQSAPTREEIEELIEFCRGRSAELDDHNGSWGESVDRALSIAERLPALLVGRETLKTAEPSEAALMEAWKANGGRESQLRAAYAIDVAPLIAERDALKEEAATLRVNVDQITAFASAQSDIVNEIVDIRDIGDKDRQNRAILESGKRAGREEGAAERGRLAADVERLVKERDAFGIANRESYSSLSAARATIAELREALGPFTEPVPLARDAYFVGLAPSIDDFNRARAALAKLDAQPAETISVLTWGTSNAYGMSSHGESLTQAASAPSHTDLMISPEAVDEALAAAPEAESVRANVELKNCAAIYSDDRLAETERALAEAVEIIRRFAFPGRNGPHDVADHSVYERARAFVEKHGGMK